MFISQLSIKGYRNFANQVIDFNDGINMIIGPNNGGKTNILRALRLIFDPHCRFRRMSIHDFHRPIGLEELQSHSPRIVVSAIIRPSEKKERELDDDLRLIRMWLTKLDEKYEACVSYVFELPASLEDEYKIAMKSVSNETEAWNLIEESFIRRYKYSIIGGNPERREKADSETLNRFDVQSLDALRNVDNDLVNSRSALLREILDFYIDFEIRNNSDITEEEKEKLQKDIKEEFKSNSSSIIRHLIKRLETGKAHMLNYASNTGASFNNATPDFNGNITEQDLYAALRIVVKYKTGVDLPISHNGLGYNNLIYISLILAKIQADTDIRRMGENAVFFPILIIEEPEAHLHPSMQYKFLSFLKNDQFNKVRQIFVSTHSTQIAAAVSLEEIICVQRDENEHISIAYPYKTFPNNDEGIKSYGYVKRFLDATRSDMLFADKIIFVEGIAEQLLLDVLARYIGYSLSDYHVCIVNAGGRYFHHFLRMFDTKSSPYAINKRVLCLTDIDPTRKGKGDKTFSRCYPFELEMDVEHYEYAINPYVDKDNQFSEVPNINILFQDKNESKTFEYDLLIHNPKCKILVTQDMSNRNQILQLMDCVNFDEAKNIFGTTKDWRKRVIDSLCLSDWDKKKKIRALIASLYLKSIDKGENALGLSNILSENLLKKESSPKDYQEFIVPQYIADGLKWLLK